MKSVKTLALSLSIIFIMTAAAPFASAQAAHVRWDIINVDFATGTVSPGGFALALAQDNTYITITGSGTFVAPARAGGDGTSSATTGGGMWQTYFPGTTTQSASGTYVVTGLVRWEQAPGTFPALVDAVDDVAKAHSGLAVLRVEFSDGSHGVLTVSSHFPSTPVTVFAGIRVSKGYVDYWNGFAPVPGGCMAGVPNCPGNRTVFHVN
jgi:hypothetical protein